MKVIERPEAKSARDKARALESTMRDMPQVDIPIRHYFAPGIYAREMTMPRDSIVVGKLHKHRCMHTISKGHVFVHTDDGVIEMKAPHTFVSERGAKRVIVAVEETVWTMYHPTDETDVDTIESIFIAKDEAEYLAYIETLKIGA